MKSPRNVLVDAVRLLLAYGVAAIHLAPNTPAAEIVGRSFLLFAVPFFLMVGLYYFAGKAFGGPAVPGWRELHFERLWLPYLAWTVVYTGLHIGKDVAVHRASGINFISTALYGGAAVHLYFLSLLLLFQVWTWSVALLWRAEGGRWPGGLAMGCSLLFALGGQVEHALGFERVFLDGALYFGGALLLWSQRDSAAFRRGNTVFASLLATGLLGLIIFGDSHDLLRYGRGPVAGYAAASLALAWPVRWPVGRWAAFLLGCSYGIYLAHFAFVEAFEFVATRLGWHVTPYGVAEKLTVALAVCAGCVALIALIRTSDLLRALLLGENASAGRAKSTSGAAPARP